MSLSINKTYNNQDTVKKNLLESPDVNNKSAFILNNEDEISIHNLKSKEFVDASYEKHLINLPQSKDVINEFNCVNYKSDIGGINTLYTCFCKNDKDYLICKHCYENCHNHNLDVILDNSNNLINQKSVNDIYFTKSQSNIMDESDNPLMEENNVPSKNNKLLDILKKQELIIQEVHTYSICKCSHHHNKNEDENMFKKVKKNFQKCFFTQFYDMYEQKGFVKIKAFDKELYVCEICFKYCYNGKCHDFNMNEKPENINRKLSSQIYNKKDNITSLSSNVFNKNDLYNNKIKFTSEKGRSCECMLHSSPSLMNFFYHIKCDINYNDHLKLFSANFIKNKKFNLYNSLIIVGLENVVNNELKIINESSDNVFDNTSALINMHSNFYFFFPLECLNTLYYKYSTNYQYMLNPFSSNFTRENLVEIFSKKIDMGIDLQGKLDEIYNNKVNIASIISIFHIRNPYERYSNTFNVYSIVNMSFLERIFYLHRAVDFRYYYHGIDASLDPFLTLEEDKQNIIKTKKSKKEINNEKEDFKSINPLNIDNNLKNLNAPLELEDKIVR